MKEDPVKFMQELKNHLKIALVALLKINEGSENPYLVREVSQFAIDEITGQVEDSYSSQIQSQASGANK